MPLTPAEVRNVTFSKPPVGRLGYHEDEVDDFLDLVHAELARLIEENNDLRNELERLGQQRHAGPVDTERNQERADQVAEEANAEADRMLSHARTSCAHLISEAQVKAEDMVNEARTQVETMLHDARTTAQTLERQSREKATSLEQDVTRKHAEIMNALNQDKSLLESTIDDLRAFEQEYRTQLAIYLQSQLDKLDEPRSVTPADPLRAQQDLVATTHGRFQDHTS